MFFENQDELNKAKEAIKELIGEVKDKFREVESKIEDLPVGKYDGETGTYYDCWEDDSVLSDISNAEYMFKQAVSGSDDFFAGNLTEVTKEEYTELADKLNEIWDILDTAQDDIPSIDYDFDDY